MKKTLLWLVIATLVTLSLTCPLVAIGQLNRTGMNTTRPDSPLADAPKPYWRVHTNPDSRSTTVQFFNKTDELIYEEAFYGRYLNLNERNAARLTCEHCPKKNQHSCRSNQRSRHNQTVGTAGESIRTPGLYQDRKRTGRYILLGFGGAVGNLTSVRPISLNRRILYLAGQLIQQQRPI